MSTATLTINLRAIQENWRALSDMSASETAAVVKADAYGLSAEPVAAALSHAGAKTFFVAVAEEGKAFEKPLVLRHSFCVLGAYGGRHADDKTKPNSAFEFSRSNAPAF